MTLKYIDLSERHGHRDDHGFSCGAEFDVKLHGRRVNIPDFVRKQISESEIDERWWEEAQRSREDLRDTLQKRYKWIGGVTFVGRGPGWLAIEDTACKPRNWDAIGKIVEKALKEFIASMESSTYWRDELGVAAVSGARKKSPAQLQREIDEALRDGSRAKSSAHATKRAIPGVGKWNTYAGGTGAAEGKHSYDLYVPEGQYTISPYTRRGGRHAGYLLKFAATGGKPRGSHGGLWHDLGSHASPQKAASAAAKHYAGGFE